MAEVPWQFSSHCKSENKLRSQIPDHKKKKSEVKNEVKITWNTMDAQKKKMMQVASWMGRQ